MVNSKNWRMVAEMLVFLIKDILGAASIILILCLLFYIELLLG